MDAEAVRKQLLVQHDLIRAHLAECMSLARRMRTGEALAGQLDAALSRLRLAFSEHNRAETELMHRLLLHDTPGRATRGTLLVERMLEEHVAEHIALGELLEGASPMVAATMDDLAYELDAHMAAEERTFLSPVIVRGDRAAAPARELPPTRGALIGRRATETRPRPGGARR
jgi:hypothetical protein